MRDEDTLREQRELFEELIEDMDSSERSYVASTAHAKIAADLFAWVLEADQEYYPSDQPPAQELRDKARHWWGLGDDPALEVDDEE